MEKPSISIALATFNGASFLEAQFQSFQEQTQQPDELVVCDDGSTDNTLVLVKQWASEVSYPVRIISNPRNLGYTRAFEIALSQCTGDIVFISDQDDVWLPGKIEMMTGLLSANPGHHLLIHDVEICSQELMPIGQTKLERMEGVFDLQWSYVTGMATVVRRRFLEHCLPIPVRGRMTYDKWLHHCAATLGVKKIVGNVLVLHRRHSKNATLGRLLNSDSVTSGKDFEKPGRSLSKKYSDLRSGVRDTVEETDSLLTWLEKEGHCLIASGCANPDHLEKNIQKLKKRMNALQLRSSVLTGQRKVSLQSTLELYKCDGYSFYRGWKSLVGDIVFRGILRF